MMKSQPAAVAPTHDDVEIAKLPLELQHELAAPTTALWRRRLVPFRGKFLVLLSAVCFSVNNIVFRKACLLSVSDHLAISFAITLLVLSAVNWHLRLPMLGPAGHRLLISVRGLLGAVSFLTYFVAVLVIKPSDATAISHSAVIMTAVLAWFFLKEKLGADHVVSIVLTSVGILLISKPSFIFPTAAAAAAAAADDHNDTNITTTSLNATLGECSHIGELRVLAGLRSEHRMLVGILSATATAFLFALQRIIMRKLSNSGVHWSVISINSSFFGVPLCVATSVLLVYFRLAHVNAAAYDTRELVYHIVLSIVSGSFNTAGNLLFNMSLVYEDPTVASIVRTTDVFFTFGLQLLVLNITLDLSSILGSFAILSGTCLVFAIKFLDRK